MSSVHGLEHNDSSSVATSHECRALSRQSSEGCPSGHVQSRRVCSWIDDGDTTTLWNYHRQTCSRPLFRQPFATEKAKKASCSTVIGRELYLYMRWQVSSRAIAAGKFECSEVGKTPTAYARTSNRPLHDNQQAVSSVAAVICQPTSTRLAPIDYSLSRSSATSNPPSAATAAQDTAHVIQRPQGLHHEHPDSWRSWLDGSFAKTVKIEHDRPVGSTSFSKRPLPGAREGLSKVRQHWTFVNSSCPSPSSHPRPVQNENPVDRSSTILPAGIPICASAAF